MREGPKLQFVCLFIFSQFRIASTDPSTLRVAACNPGSVPYVIFNESSQLTGFDIGEAHRFPAFFMHARESDTRQLAEYLLC
jgi:hypothetical protein